MHLKSRAHFLKKKKKKKKKKILIKCNPHDKIHPKYKPDRIDSFNYHEYIRGFPALQFAENQAVLAPLDNSIFSFVCYYTEFRRDISSG